MKKPRQLIANPTITRNHQDFQPRERRSRRESPNRMRWDAVRRPTRPHAAPSTTTRTTPESTKCHQGRARSSAPFFFDEGDLHGDAEP
jgi:hypothetical protein